MTELRKQFEVLHHIESMMQLCGAEYHAITRTYKIESTGLNDREVCSFVNGAWYAFQEQQKKIDSLLDHVCGSFEDFK